MPKRHLILAVIYLIALQIHCQYPCPGLTFLKVCDQCPDKCNGPNLGDQCDRNGPDANYLKCKQASWGNIQTSYMGLQCSLTGTNERYPIIPIQSPEWSAPLHCNGTILRGLWPYDEENMTFSIDTMFRDPTVSQDISTASNSTTGILNSIYMGCMEFRMTPVKAFSSGQDASGELVACTLSDDDLKNFNYIGLNLMICVNTNPLSDPTCEQGQWVTVINGACVEEAVIAQVALQDYGNRLLIRIGGPGNLTACQPRWTLDIARTTGDCFTTDPGYGTCCDMSCVHGRRITQTCFCYCSPGFTGAACDRMLPVLQVDLVLGNTSLADWLAFSRTETRSIQVSPHPTPPPRTY